MLRVLTDEMSFLDFSSQFDSSDSRTTVKQLTTDLYPDQRKNNLDQDNNEQYEICFLQKDDEISQITCS